MGKAVAKTGKRDALRLDAARALRELSPPRRLAVEAVLHSATRPLALEKLLKAGVDIDLATLHNWCRSAPFIRALKAREAQIAAQITKDSVINNARNLLEMAVEGEPITSTDRKTGETEIIGTRRDVRGALQANEQMGKAVGAFNADHSGKVAVIIDIDFSGRKDAVRETVIDPKSEAIDAEFEEVKPPELAEWLQ